MNWTCRFAPYGFRSGEFQSTRSRRLVETVAERQPDAYPRVVATLTAGASLYELTRNLKLGGWLSQSLQVVLGLPSTVLKGGRPHLVQLGGIRRFAEEWDLAVAVDLSGQFDPDLGGRGGSRAARRTTDHSADQRLGAVASRGWARPGRVPGPACRDGPGSPVGCRGRASKISSVSNYTAGRVVRRAPGGGLRRRARCSARSCPARGIQQLRGKPYFTRDLMRTGDASRTGLARIACSFPPLPTAWCTEEPCGRA